MTNYLLRTALFGLISLTGLASCLAVFAAVPIANIKILPMVEEKSVSTYVPSQSASGQGLALNIIYPKTPRYKEGAPVVVVIPAGDGPNGLDFSIHAAQAGFVEVRFCFPADSTKNGKVVFRSSGTNDYRGVNSQLALRDIILFAMGKSKDFQGRKIKDLLSIKIAQNNLGLVGWSHGGNIALVTMDKYATDLASISWIAFYESPLGSLFFPPSLGSVNDLLLNKHYRQGSAATGRCLIDFRKLAFEPQTTRNPGVHKKLGEPDLPGVIYFDENGNGVWDESTEFAFNYSLDHEFGKQIYPPEVTAAAERHNIFGDTWPTTIATLKESEAYFEQRDGGACIPSICAQYPHLLVTIFGSQIDHLQRQADHPHIILQYNSWLDSGTNWVRLNPEPIYLTQIANMATGNFVNNQPRQPIDAAAINNHLEPEGMLKDYVFIDAAIAELADRKRSNNLASPLDEPIVNYTNGLPVPPLAPPSASPLTKPTNNSKPTQKNN